MQKLTKREEEILELLTKGLSNVEIGKVLFISRHTVKAHIHNIMKKIEAKDRVNAAYLAGYSRIV